MKTQLSRQSFKAEKRYSGVFQQMGRMITDADWNELTDLLQYEVSDALADVIGSGTPRNRGVVVEINPGEYALRWGHLYAEGQRGILRPQPDVYTTDFQFSEQADFPDTHALTAGQYRLYADLWDRTVTHLEDPDLLDTALKGADTCTRTQRMVQIKACPVEISAEDLQSNDLINPAIGSLPLDLSIRLGETLKDPCDPCADELALQDKVGNYLFRVEVHDVIWEQDEAGDPELVGLVLKWSSENGAEHYQVGAVPPGFESSRWCYEFLPGPEHQMVTEKHLGHHLQPGFNPARSELFDGYPASEPADLVRRWDGFIRLEKVAGVWALQEGADRGRELSTGYGDNAHGYVALDDSLHINLDALELSLDLADGVALAGDYWLATVRQAEHNPGDVVLEGALPQGIRHYYWSLGRVMVDDAGHILNFEPDPDAACKAHGFPPLTDISARDVCYDNDACEMPEVKSVQDAIDYLCKARDLRWHHKHLHGMGVVCGLVVQCGSDTVPGPDGGEAVRRHIKVTQGAALDCEGNILTLDETREIDLMDRVEEMLAQHQDALPEGNGQVCLWIEQGPNGEPRLRIEPYTQQNKTSLLDGTLWMDFYQHCIKDLLDEIRAIFAELGADQGENNTELVTAGRKEATTLLNLLAHFIYGHHGQRVFLSEKEHEILRTFYLRLRTLLQSKTFCGMYQGQDFPDYPDEWRGIGTAFGKNHHERMVIHPTAPYALTFQGTDTTVNIYDLEQERITAITQVRSGEGSTVTAVAFTNEGDLVYAATAINANDSILTRGRFEDGKIDWEDSVILCGVRAEKLFFVSEDNQLYMIGYGRGLYQLNLLELFGEDKVFPSPRWEFNATGQADFVADDGEVFAAAADRGVIDPTHYNKVYHFNVHLTVNAPVNTFELPASGQDDLIVQNTDTKLSNQLHVVINRTNSSKAVWSTIYRSQQDVNNVSNFIDLGTNSTIRLCISPNRQDLLVSVQDEFRVRSYSYGQPLVERIPVQLMPSAMAVAGYNRQLVVLNYMSNTLTLYPPDRLDVSDSRVNALVNYRNQIFLAFLGLFGNLLQHLKDCFCNHLLIKCPSCDEDQKVYLAKIEIRENRVYKICNFGKRKDVWTFPKVEYWMSIVPIIPMIKAGFTRFCCLVLPNLFGNTRREEVLDSDDTGDLSRDQQVSHTFLSERPRAYAPTGQTYQAMVGTTKTFDTTRAVRENRSKLQTTMRLGSDTVLHRGARERLSGVGKLHYQTLPVEQTVEQLSQKNIQVAEVVHYDRTHSQEALRHYTRTPDRIPEGSEVVVYEEQGRTLFYAIKSTPTQSFDTAAAEVQMNQLQQQKERVVADIMKAQADLQTMEVQKQQTQSQLQKMQQDYQSMASQREVVKTEMEALTSQFGSLREELQMMKVEVVKERPVREALEVTEDEAKILSDLGVRSVGDLDKVEMRVLIEQGGLDRTKVDKLMGDYQRLTTIKRL